MPRNMHIVNTIRQGSLNPTDAKVILDVNTKDMHLIARSSNQAYDPYEPCLTFLERLQCWVAPE
jgi:hypothetical protein